jgi:hypothetical protein
MGTSFYSGQVLDLDRQIASGGQTAAMLANGPFDQSGFAITCAG